MIEQLLKRLRDEITAQNGAEQARLEVLEHIRQPFSDVYRIRAVTSTNGDPRRLIAKVYKLNSVSPEYQKRLGRIVKEYETCRSLSLGLEDTDEINVSVPVAYYLDLHTLVMEESPGKPLATLILRDARFPVHRNALLQLKNHCLSAGRALRRLQQLTHEAKSFDPASLVEYIDVRLKFLEESKLGTDGSRLRQTVLDHLALEIPQVDGSELELAGRHGDYGPFNILIGTDGLTIIDFSTYGLGSIFDDLTYFWKRLDNLLHKPWYRPLVIADLQHSLSEGFGYEEVERRRLFRLFLLKHTVNRVSTIIKDRRGDGEKYGAASRWYNRVVMGRELDQIRRLCEGTWSSSKARGNSYPWLSRPGAATGNRITRFK